MKKTDDNVLKIQKQGLSNLRTQYLSAVRGMALSADGSAEYWQSKGEAIDTRDKAFILFGHAAAEILRKDGIREWNRIRAGA